MHVAEHERLIGLQRPFGCHRVVDPFALSSEAVSVVHHRNRVAVADPTGGMEGSVSIAKSDRPL